MTFIWSEYFPTLFTKQTKNSLGFELTYQFRTVWTKSFKVMVKLTYLALILREGLVVRNAMVVLLWWRPSCPCKMQHLLITLWVNKSCLHFSRNACAFWTLLTTIQVLCYFDPLLVGKWTVGKVVPCSW